jgi:hypothetical protein
VIDQLNTLAARIPRAAFRAEGVLDCLAYVLVHAGEVIYAGEGLSGRAILHLKDQGVNSPALADYIARYHNQIEIYYAAANITKAVAVELENVLIEEFKPRFNIKSPMSIWAYLPEGPDTFGKMTSAEKVNLSPTKPPRDTHAAQWKRCRNDEIPPDWIITRIGLHQKNNQDRLQRKHYDSYPPLGGTTTVAEHRRRNEAQGLKWTGVNGIRSILHWDRIYPDLITITPE